MEIQRFAPMLMVLLAAACSGKPEPEPQQTQAGPAAEGSAAESPAASAAAEGAEAAGATSRYTSLKDCKDVESGAAQGEDWAIATCPGLGPWRVRRDYGDAREYLRLTRDPRKGAEPKLIATGSYGFNTLGDTLEWRGTGQGQAFTAAALIFRNSVSENPDDSSKQTSYLLVYDLRQGCTVARIAPQPGQNDAARAAADGPQLACLKED